MNKNKKNVGQYQVKNQKIKTNLFKTVSLLFLFGLISSTLAASVPTVPISQIPLTVAVPAHPQVLIAIGNSQSMDGDINGEIYTGSGALGTAFAPLLNSSSPTNYTIPANFTPPVNAGSGGVAPYTVTTSGIQYDNSDSRLNVAKAGLEDIITTFSSTTDFALMDYNTSGNSEYTTWVYYMSGSSGFQFTSTIPATGLYVANPCYNVSLTSGTSVSNDCSQLNSFYGSITGKQYMLISASSDQPAINDVLYASGLEPIFMTYNGPSPANPFPPNFSIGQYNSGSILESYNSSVPGGNNFGTSPTNAGYVPYTPQVMYVERGFGFYTTGESPNNGTLLVPMSTAGQTPTTATTTALVAKFTPYFAAENNTTSTPEIKATAAQSPIAGVLAGAQTYLATKPASSNGCAASQYVVLVTDGLPTLDLSNNAWPPIGSASALGYGVTATFNADGSLGTTNDQALTDTITTITNLRKAGVKVYIIGLGAGVEPANNQAAANTLTAMAVAGGTSNYFPATSATDLANDLQVILSTILSATQDISSAAVNSTGLNTGSVVYQAQFVTSDAYQDWTGNLFEFPINATTGQVVTNPTQAIWSAQTELDTENWNTGRLIATWNPTTKTAIPFRWSTTGTGITPTTTLGLDLMSSTTDTNGPNRLNYLRGDTLLEQRSGGSYRNRAHILGDIVDSDPLYIGGASGSYQQSSYLTFEQTVSTRPPVIYVGANDGMLHAFDAVTGKERFAYIPNGVFNHLINLANPFYNEQHLFFVDGSPQASDIQFADNSWHTVLLGTEQGGGNTVFALDATAPQNITNETNLSQSVLWEFIDANMGLSYGTPVIAETNYGALAFFGNGYNSTTGTPYLYAVNPQTGATVSKINLCAQVAATICKTTLANGLSGVVAVNATGALGAPVNLLYAGDLQGNIWRINITSANPSSWTVSVLFQARDSSGNPQPITTTPSVTLNPQFPQRAGTMVFFGTGQLLGTADLSSTQTQTVYGVFDPGGATGNLTYTRSNLVAQTLTSATISTPNGNESVRLVSGNAVNLATTQGWYVDLNLQSGERVVTNSHIEDGGGVVLTTYTPSASICVAGGNAYLMTFNFATGGQFAQPEFDINGDGQLNSGDQVSGKNPVGMSLGTVYAASPTIISANLGNSTIHADKLVTESSGKIQGILERGGVQHRTSWWEIQQ